jgi:hypothetical protein
MEWGGEAIFMIGNLAVIQHSGLRRSQREMAMDVLSRLTLSLTPCFSWVVNDVSEDPQPLQRFFCSKRLNR